MAARLSPGVTAPRRAGRHPRPSTNVRGAARSHEPGPEEELELDVVVEVPKGCRNKYEYDHEQHVFRLAERLLRATPCPVDYGFIPETLAADGAPLDALVLVEEPTFPGCRVASVPVGIYWVADELGPDPRVICAPKAEPRWRAVTDIDQVPQWLREEIGEFFENPHASRPRFEPAIQGYEGRKAALAAIEAARTLFAVAGPASGPWVSYS